MRTRFAILALLCLVFALFGPTLPSRSSLDGANSVALGQFDRPPDPGPGGGGSCSYCNQDACGCGDPAPGCGWSFSCGCSSVDCWRVCTPICP